jgi:hypothetical protein
MDDRPSLLSQQSVPQQPPALRRKHRRVTRPGIERESIPGLADDERGGFESNDSRLAADVPPHWGERGHR